MQLTVGGSAAGQLRYNYSLVVLRSGVVRQRLVMRWTRRHPVNARAPHITPHGAREAGFVWTLNWESTWEDGLPCPPHALALSRFHGCHGACAQCVWASMLNGDSTEKRPKTGFLHMNHSGNFRRTIKKPGFFSELIGRVQAGSQFATRKNNTTTSVLHNRECGKSAIPIMVGAGWRGIDL